MVKSCLPRPWANSKGFTLRKLWPETNNIFPKLPRLSECTEIPFPRGLQPTKKSLDHLSGRREVERVRFGRAFRVIDPSKPIRPKLTISLPRIILSTHPHRVLITGVAGLLNLV